MAQAESDIVHDIQKAVSPRGARLFKNTRGSFYTLDSVRALITAALSLNVKSIADAIRNLRQLRAGLQVAGSSDLIGFRPVVITQEMVGTTMAIFVAAEVKTKTGAANEEQVQFVTFVAKNGGFAGIVRSAEDALKIMKYPVD